MLGQHRSPSLISGLYGTDGQKQKQLNPGTSWQALGLIERAFAQYKEKDDQRKLPMSASGLYKQGHIYVHVLPPHTHTNTHVNINTHIHTYTKKILFFLPNLTAKIYFKKMCRKNKFLYTTYTHSDTNAQIQVQSMRFEFLLLKLSEICCSVSAYLAANEGHWRNELCQVS